MIIYLSSINRLVFEIETQYSSCEVGTEIWFSRIKMLILYTFDLYKMYDTIWCVDSYFVNVDILWNQETSNILKINRGKYINNHIRRKLEAFVCLYVSEDGNILTSSNNASDAQCCEMNQCSIVKQGQTEARISNSVREGSEVELIIQHCQNEEKYNEEYRWIRNICLLYKNSNIFT